MLGLLGDKKKAVQAIVDRVNPEGDVKSKVSNEDSELDMVSEEILAAITAKSPTSLSSALKSFYEICESREHEEMGEEEESEGMY